MMYEAREGEGLRPARHVVRRRPGPEALARLALRSLAGQLELHVLRVIAHREEDVARIAIDAHVAAILEVGNPVEGRMGLDDPAVGLAFEQRDGLVQGLEGAIEPG